MRTAALLVLFPALAWPCSPEMGGPTLLAPAPNEARVPRNALIVIVEAPGTFVPTMELVTDAGAVPVTFSEAWRVGSTVALRPDLLLPAGGVIRLPGVFDATFMVGSASDTAAPLLPAAPVPVPEPAYGSAGQCFGSRVIFMPRQPDDEPVTYELATDAGLVASAMNHLEVWCGGGLDLRRTRGDVVLHDDAGTLWLSAIDRAGQRGPARELALNGVCALFDAGGADAGEDVPVPAADAGNDAPSRKPAQGCSTSEVTPLIACALLAVLRRRAPQR